MRTLVFVYGTLQSEMQRDINVLARREGASIKPLGAAISEHQYICHIQGYSYPYLESVPSGMEYLFGLQGRVEGEVYEVPTSFVNDVLDNIEGFCGDYDNSLFIRSFSYFRLENGDVVKALVYIKGGRLNNQFSVISPSFLGEMVISDFNRSYIADIYGSRDDSEDVVYNFKKLHSKFLTINK